MDCGLNAHESVLTELCLPSLVLVPEQGGVPLIPMHGSPLAQWQLEMIEATFKQGRNLYDCI